MTPVIFKREGNDIVAIFPTLPGTNEFDMTCYAHIGRHSSCAANYASSLKPAKPEEFAVLHAELVRIGYDDLQIVRKVTQKHFAARREAMKL